jgi:hypothetical protein
MFTFTARKLSSAVFFSANFKSETSRHYVRSRGLERKKVVAVAVADAGW